jgi:hypothetical protein
MTIEPPQGLATLARNAADALEQITTKLREGYPGGSVDSSGPDQRAFNAAELRRLAGQFEHHTLLAQMAGDLSRALSFSGVEWPENNLKEAARWMVEDCKWSAGRRDEMR